MLCAMYRTKQTKFELTIPNHETTKRVVKDSTLPADQPTLPRGLSLNQGYLEQNNHGNLISIHGPSHQSPRTMNVVHTAH